jgi:hypothetical protein
MRDNQLLKNFAPTVAVTYMRHQYASDTLYGLYYNVIPFKNEKED